MSAIIVTVIMITCVCLDVYICIVLHRHWGILAIGDLQASLATVMRVLVFSAFSVVGIVSVFLSVSVLYINLLFNRLGLIFFLTPEKSHGAALDIVLCLRE